CMSAREKERAGMKRDPSRSRTRNLADELAELRGLDPTALKQRWRALYRTEAPVRIGHALLLQAVAYRLQGRGLGGLERTVAAAAQQLLTDEPAIAAGVEEAGVAANRMPSILETTRIWSGKLRSSTEAAAALAALVHRVELSRDGLRLSLKVPAVGVGNDPP